MQKGVVNRVFGLDLMRAAAISLVVFSHLFWILPQKTGAMSDLMGIAGVLGVEVFFVLSGFLIGRIVYRFFISETFSLLDVKYFWVRRWFRTLPNYYLALFLNCFVVWYIGNSLPDQWWQYLFFVQNFAWEMPSFFYESWSLSIEEFAYIIGPLLLYLFVLARPKTVRKTLFLRMTLGILVLSVLLRVWYNQHNAVTTMQYWNLNVKAAVIYRIDAVYYGVLAAYISLIRPEFWKRSKYLTFIIGMALLLILNIGIPLKGIFIENYPFFWNVLYLPSCSLAILLTLPLLSQWSSAPYMILKPVTTLSLISYAMYVLHYSVILQLLKYFLPTEGLSGLDIVEYVMVYLAIVLMASYVLYKLFEKPMTDLRDRPTIAKRFKQN